jgi:hypothetical protein
VQEEREKELDEALAHKGVVGSLGLVMAASKQVTVAVSAKNGCVDIEWSWGNVGIAWHAAQWQYE